MEATVPWDMLAAGYIPNVGGLIIILIIRQFVEQYAYFVCCQISHFLWWGGRIVSIHHNVVLLVLGFVNKRC